MFKEFLLRRRAFKGGRTCRGIHEDADVGLLSGDQFILQVDNQWKRYCRGKKMWPEEQATLQHNDALSAISIQTFIQGYKDWEEGRVKGVRRMQGFQAARQTAARSIGHSLVTWQWTKRFLHWMIISAGTMSECVFLIASLWVSVNANVHAFVLLFISEDATKFLTELATTAYVILPECIVGLAVVVTLSHLRTWRYNKRDYRPAIWAALYGMPTFVFLFLSLVTLGCSVANATFEMPTWAVVIRALSGYWFAFTLLLYTQLGAPQERDRLAKKDGIIAQLHNETRRLNDVIEHQKSATC